MNAPTNIQVINDQDGKPAFVVIPYADYAKSQEKLGDTYVPHEVVSLMVDNDWTITRAWREHLGITQADISERLGISQPAYSQQEASPNIRKATRAKIAEALGITPEQLDV
ncbi:MAG: helix-turn-helix transcriptional regulator [Burkholderiaceae bacterium]|nr:helix-turn-helix transcriptional regulator [Burkholderiaceae bacterium]